jgi:hypothetical protein
MTHYPGLQIKVVLGTLATLKLQFRLVCETFLLHYLCFLQHHVVSLAGSLTYQQSDLDQLPLLQIFYLKKFWWVTAIHEYSVHFNTVHYLTLHLHNVYHFWIGLTKLTCVYYTFTGQLCTANICLNPPLQSSLWVLDNHIFLPVVCLSR